MNEFMFSRDSRAERLREEQAAERLEEETKKARTQEDLDRLEHQAAIDAQRSIFEPTATWGRGREISLKDLPQRGPLEDQFKRIAADVQALYAMNAAWRDALLSAYNGTVGDLSRMQVEAQRVSDQVKFLGLSLDAKSDDVYYVDSLLNSAGLLPESTCHVERGATLKREGLDDLGSSAMIQIVGQGKVSNGLPGNKHEVLTHGSSESLTAKDIGLEDQAIEFIGRRDPHDKLGAINDGSFDTWFEYEAYQLPREVSDALYQGFGLQNVDGSRWVVDPDFGPLRLVLRLELPQISEINWLQVVPYIPRGAEGPALESIETSIDGLRWEAVPHKGGDISTLNRKLGAIVKGSEFGTANVVSEEVVQIPPRRARFVKISLRADRPYETDVGHTAYFKTNGENRFRVEGPDLGVPSLPYQPPRDVEVKFESSRASRYAIGLREIAIRSNRYASTSELITKAFEPQGGGYVDRVSLSVDDLVPETWWNGDFKLRSQFIRYFISRDGGNTWLPITPEGHPYGPEDPPTHLAVPAGSSARSLQVKAILARPEGVQGTPVIKRIAVRMELRREP